MSEPTPSPLVLADLVERVRAGGDRDLDRDLCELFYPEWAQRKLRWGDGWMDAEVGMAFKPTPITSSLDAAVALTERALGPETYIRVGQGPDGCDGRVARYGAHGRATMLVNRGGKTAPLALLAATLSALQGETKEAGE